MIERMYSSDAIDKQFVKIKDSQNTIVLSKSHSNVFRFLLWSQTFLTLISMGISITSAFREDKSLAMSRSSYWWHFFFCIVIIVSLYQSLSAIHKRNGNKEDFACFLISIFVLLVIEVLIISYFLFVSLPPNELIGKSI